jgi:hypothetical protein
VVVCGWVMVATRWSRIICYEYNVSCALVYRLTGG